MQVGMHWEINKCYTN